MTDSTQAKNRIIAGDSHRGMTRRELLAAFLGIPVALAACGGPPPPALPPGEIVGASDALGHKLRDGFRPKPAADRWQSAGAVIVGGGIAGLTAAWRFERAGFSDYVLLELEGAPGGTARHGDSGVVPYPWGAHYIPAPLKENQGLITLLDEMGILEGADSSGDPVVGEQYLCRDPEERVYYKGFWYEGLYLHAGATDADEAELKAFHAEVDRWVAWRDGRGRRAFTIPVALASDDAEVTALDKISMSTWMSQKSFNSPRLRWLVNYACRDDYGLTIDDTSAWAGLFYFASRVPRPGVEARSLITWPAGNGRLADHLYGKVKDKVRLGVAVSDILPASPDGRLTEIEVTAVSADGAEAFGFRTPHVIFAAPHFLAKYLIAPFRAEPPAYLADFHYGAWMVANLFLRDRPESRGFPLSWDNVLYESDSLGYVVATHQRGLDRGATIFTYYYPLCDSDGAQAREQLLATSRDQWADIALTDLTRPHNNIRKLVDRLDVMRWGHAMIRPTPGFMWGASRRQGAEPYRGIHFANTDLSGVALFEEAFYHGVRAAEEILKSMGRPVGQSTLLT